MDYYIYILYSKVADKYYVGYSSNPQKRLKEHNSYENKSKFTAKYQPWNLKAHFLVSQTIGEAMRVERFIKQQKSRHFLERLISEHHNAEFINDLIKKVIG
ncbi:GIY-YIG nuclease family protein [Carboxylicivirga sediminis]|uniref:GIY-YIG nuclease family protein n=1 Tax=Carboxylicivirga sediminis TaxID=2006564 RepID=A0A941F0G9_9BACT|nr:GIY-YIG nuclease family protein [Carboxylicivirga sediminis]MBR8534247.1 GIY-YIG nuclease family protein [Carboxylicivirga sediminis]